MPRLSRIRAALVFIAAGTCQHMARPGRPERRVCDTPLSVEPARVLDVRCERVRRAGAGGMGRGYLAHDRRAGGPVAVKVLHAEGAAPAERFAREVEALAGLSHPAIVRF